MRSVTCRFGLLSAVLALGLGASGLAQQRQGSAVSVVINEVMALNHATLADSQGRYDDWIELYNTGSMTVDLGGCYLTDDLSAPTKWQIPAGTTIAGHGFLLIWADGGASGSGLHAGFQLSEKGETVGLFAANGVTLIDSVSFGPQQADVSYGRFPDGGPDWRATASPTPGVANAFLYEGIVEPPRINIKSGFCSEPISVTLATATPGATIYCSVDGSDPLECQPEPEPVRGDGRPSLHSSDRHQQNHDLEGPRDQIRVAAERRQHRAVHLLRPGCAGLQLAAADCRDRHVGPGRTDHHEDPRVQRLLQSGRYRPGHGSERGRLPRTGGHQHPRQELRRLSEEAISLRNAR